MFGNTEFSGPSLKQPGGTVIISGGATFRGNVRFSGSVSFVLNGDVDNWGTMQFSKSKFRWISGYIRQNSLIPPGSILLDSLSFAQLGPDPILQALPFPISQFFPSELVLTGGSVSNEGTMVKDATLSAFNNANITNKGKVNFEGGCTVSGSALIQNDGSGVLTKTGAATDRVKLFVLNDGTITVKDGILFIGHVTNQGVIREEGGKFTSTYIGALLDNSGGTLENTGRNRSPDFSGRRWACRVSMMPSWHH